MYKKDKLEQFNRYVLEEYNDSLVIEDIAKISLVEKTDGKFVQIGIRPLIEDEFLIAQNFDPRLPGVGRAIASGEEDYLIQNILDKKEIERIEFKEDLKEFPKYVFEFDSAVILLSTKFFVEVFTKLMHRIDYGEKYPRLDGRYRIISVPEKVFGNKIIIIDRNAILWDKELFENESTGRKEKIDINIRPASMGKVDITIRSVNKIKYLNPELIKILEVQL